MILSVFDALDPAREMRDVDAALLTSLFDKYAELDPELYRHRLNAHSPGALSYACSLDSTCALAALNEVISGQPSSDWILATGMWNDSGVWDDTSNWQDA
jgi:hypothetical protein